MTSFEQARNIILESVSPVGVERVQLLDAVGRVMAESFAAPWDLPRRDYSAMDGYAVKSADCVSGVPLRVTGFLPAGADQPETVLTGCAVRIMTGAPIPQGADAVVPLEEAMGAESAVIPARPVRPGEQIRFRGSEVAAGEEVVASGDVIGPRQVALLASFNCAMVPVYRRLRVAIASSGDELVELGTQHDESRLVNSNAFALAAAVKLLGAEPVMLGIARDSRESHRALLGEGMNSDALITSAGVSAGDRDLVRESLAALGMEERFWKVAIRPGGASAFGMKGSTPVFSLPGTPASTMIAFEELVRPALLKMMGHTRTMRRGVRGILEQEQRIKPGALNFLRVRVAVQEGRYLASTAGGRASGRREPLQQYNALALLPAGRSSFQAGDEVDLHILDQTIEMEA